MSKRKQFIRDKLNKFVPTVIANIINEYESLSGKCEITLEGHTKTVYKCVVLPNSCSDTSSDNTSYRIISGSTDGLLKIWNVQTGTSSRGARSSGQQRILEVKCEMTLDNCSDSINFFDILPDGRIISGVRSLNFDMVPKLKVWNIQNGICELNSEDFPDGTCCPILSTEKVIVGTAWNAFQIWNLQTGQYEQTFHYHHNDISYCFALADGRIVTVCGFNANTLKIWNVQSGKCEQTLKGHMLCINFCVILPDGRLVSGSADKTLKIWNTYTEHYDNDNDENDDSDNEIINYRYCELSLEGHKSHVSCCSILPDGRIVSGSYDKTLKIWNTKTGKCEMTLKGHTDWVKCCSVLPDGSIISGSFDKTIKVWNAETGKCETTLKGHAHWVMCCSVLPGGRIISGSEDGMLKIWS
jgi:WD40 repeat protein